MAAGLSSSNENSLSSLNDTLAAYWNYYNWCEDYPTGPLIWSAISVICFLLGFPACLWVLHELLQRQRQRSKRDIFMLSLAVIDLIFTAPIPFCLCNFMLWRNKELELLLDFIFCLSITGRPLFMACICWDCYNAVVHPIVYKTSKKLILVKKAITVTICFTVVVSGLAICYIKWLVTTPFMAVPLIVALPVIMFCDISMLRALRKPGPTGNKDIHPQKRQALLTISNSFIMTCIVYLPPVIIFSFGKLIPVGELELYCGLFFSGCCFNMAGCVIMPILYLASVRKLDMLRNCWKKSST